MVFKKGESSWNKGKHGYETPQQIEVRVSKIRGRKHTQEELDKISLAHTGHETTQSTRDKIRLARSRHNHIDFSDLRELYVNQRLSTPKIAKIKGCGTCVIATQLRNRGINLRSLSEANIGDLNPRYGKSPSAYTKEKMRTKLSRENNPAWRGGTRRGKYDLKFSEELREIIRKRDNYTCQLCGALQNGLRFDVHHIDYNRQHSYDDNLITLCHPCHCKTNHHRDYWQINLVWLISIKIAT